jgi:hypothetical protein
MVSSTPIVAHEVRPAYLELREIAPERYEMVWKQPLNEGRRLRIEPRLDPACEIVEREQPEITTGGSGALVERFTLDCTSNTARQSGAAPVLFGRTLSVEGLERTITDVLVHVQRLDGTQQRHLLKPTAPAIDLAATASTKVPAYLMLGIEHLLFGFDHILFVVGLLFFVRSPLRLVQTITAFTVAHSITLALSTLGLVRLSPGPVEAAIALSILFLAVELLHPVAKRSALTRDRPWLFAFCFGLLHGFGFAGALAEIGLPKGAVALALFLFNLGVEVGQLLVVGVVLSALALLGKRAARLPLHIQRLPIYLMGVLAARWFVERTVALI